MAHFSQSRKATGIWIMVFCTMITLFCVTHRKNKSGFLKSYALIEIVADDKKSVIEVELTKNRADQNERLGLNTLNLNKEVSTKGIFLGRTEASIAQSVQHRANSSRIENDNYKNGEDRDSIKVGVLIPSSTRTIKTPALEKLSLTKMCIPSIYKTMEMEYTYVIYVGIDIGDYLESAKDKLEIMFSKVRSVVTIGGTFTKSVNAIAREAYRDGMDYLVRINDDSSFESQNWTSTGISVLQNYSPPNVGVVGPTCNQGNTRILTHDMVHRTHLDIFDFYYPPYFDNWWADDWITKVYNSNRTTKLPTWLVKHHLSSHGTRYNVDGKHKIRLDKTLTFDRERLTKHLSHYKP